MDKYCYNCKNFISYYSKTPRGFKREVFGCCTKKQKMVDLVESCNGFSEKEETGIDLTVIINSLNRAISDINKITHFLEDYKVK